MTSKWTSMNTILRTMKGEGKIMQIKGEQQKE